MTTSFLREVRSWLAALGLMGIAAILTGCVGPGGGTGGADVGKGADIKLRPGEGLVISYADVNPQIPPFQGSIRDDGKIVLLFNQEFQAAGKTVAELEKDIHDRYVTNFFQNLTATVQPQDRYFYVDGQVHMPNRFPYQGNITFLGAIAAAQGLTDFAAPTRIQIIRASGKSEKVNYNKIKDGKAPDVRIYPDDRVIVPRRLF